MEIEAARKHLWDALSLALFCFASVMEMFECVLSHRRLHFFLITFVYTSLSLARCFPRVILCGETVKLTQQYDFLIVLLVLTLRLIFVGFGDCKLTVTSCTKGSFH